ncbi:unnamed protein product [Meloidogyne enterolobii]|uniref:Uncharacterized protein n=1 Tax=Meloidogyne enterolobii TaxID=390850 RepID=A0ACB1ALV6_MELEN
MFKTGNISYYYSYFHVLNVYPHFLSFYHFHGIVVINIIKFSPQLFSTFHFFYFCPFFLISSPPLFQTLPFCLCLSSPNIFFVAQFLIFSRGFTAFVLRD